MKGHTRSIRKALEQSFERAQTMAAAESRPAWERLMDRQRENAGGVFEGPEFADPVRVERSMKALWAAVAAAAIVLAVLIPIAVRRPAAASLEVGARKVHFGETVRSEIFGEIVKLEDGSRVEMKTNSELVLERADDGVRIRLDQGDIIVTAAKQHGHLYVKTKDVTVSVVGTVFYVKAERQGSRVAVFEGEVHVKQGQTEKKLGPGEQVTSNPTMESLPVNQEVAWSRQAVAHIALLQQATTARGIQTSKEETLAFEVARIRPAAPAPAVAGARSGAGGGARGPCSVLGMQLDSRRLSLTNVSINELVGLAIGPCHGLAGGPGFRRLSGGPEWIRTERWDLEALLPEGSGSLPSTPFGGAITEFVEGRSPKLQKMLMTFLEERFKVIVRSEMKEMPVYLLTVAPGGPKFQGNTFDYRMRFTGPGMYTPDMDAAAEAKVKGITASEGATVAWANVLPCFRQPDQTCQAAMYLNQPMNIVVNHLSWWAGRPIVDRTGIQEKVSFVAEWPYAYTSWGRGRGAPPPPSFQEVSKGLESVGLELKENSKGPAEAFVIERAEKPSEN